MIGLYLNPPQHAAVFCVDEKTAIQALDRLDPVLPLSPGRAEPNSFPKRPPLFSVIGLFFRGEWWPTRSLPTNLPVLVPVLQPPKIASTITSESFRVISTARETSSINSALVMLSAFPRTKIYSYFDRHGCLRAVSKANPSICAARLCRLRLSRSHQAARGFRTGHVCRLGRAA